MGIYVVTGASTGIGLEAAKYLCSAGHQVINIDRDKSEGQFTQDITADLGTPAGRRTAIEAVRTLCPEGLDGLILNAGIGVAGKFSTVLSVNFFGTVAIAEGLFELLRLKKGSCAVTVSGSIAYINRTKYYVDNLLVNCGDEERIGRLVDSFDAAAPGNAIYGSTKIALVRWLRRMAPSWAARGVNLNAVAPGAVATSIMPDTPEFRDGFETFTLGFPMPTVYHDKTMMNPASVGPALAMLVLPEAKGICGAVLYCDGGTSAILHPEKFY
jgi:NAD(P)-dependent dehydrogenase (short-subunit alcohol dehydrogenase family)